MRATREVTFNSAHRYDGFGALVSAAACAQSRMAGNSIHWRPMRESAKWISWRAQAGNASLSYADFSARSRTPFEVGILRLHPDSNSKPRDVLLYAVDSYG